MTCPFCHVEFSATPAELADRPFPQNDTDTDLCSIFAFCRIPEVPQ